MIKIQDLINIGQYEISSEAEEAIDIIADEFRDKNSATTEEIEAETIHGVECAIMVKCEAYTYLKDHTDGDLTEAIIAGKTAIIDIARFYLIKELFEKLEEIKND